MPAAEQALDKALGLAPETLEVLVLMGIVRARKGELDVAATYLERAISLDSNCFEAETALSTVLFRAGRLDDAVAHGEKAIAIRPKDPSGYQHLAGHLLRQRLVSRAVPYLREALKLTPDSVPLIQDLATALTELGQREDAIELWRRLTRFHPRLPLGWVRLANLLLAERQSEEAVSCGRKAVQVAPELPDAHLVLGLALLSESEGTAALSELERVLELKPDGLFALSAYGLALQEAGQFEKARPVFERLNVLYPAHGQAYYSLMSTGGSTAALVDQARQNLENPSASPLDRSYMHYALGKALEDAGSFEEAMGHYDEATSLAAQYWFDGRPPNRERYAEMIQATIETFTPSFFGASEADSDSELPLLVVGMIRSGTTLVEQILSSHPQIVGAGELPFWQQQARKLWDMPARSVDEAGLRKAGRAYLELLGRRGPEAARVIDKLPHNYATIGFLLAALPRARVIYVKRDALDNCLSIYTTAYQHPPEFTLIRSNIVFQYREHERVMAHWRRVLRPEQLLEVSYESLIEDREAVSRRMVEFAGLEWDDACLAHEKNPRSVNTPSLWQVRQPIYNTSVGRWRRFEPWLGEFSELAAKG
jgi:tetratricopeptide (TPR) repeat protein